jgi:hypothetical protein
LSFRLLYEQGRFCVTFHSDDAGWRTCNNCKKVSLSLQFRCDVVVLIFCSICRLFCLLFLLSTIVCRKFCLGFLCLLSYIADILFTFSVIRADLAFFSRSACIVVALPRLPPLFCSMLVGSSARHAQRRPYHNWYAYIESVSSCSTASICSCRSL